MRGNRTDKIQGWKSDYQKSNPTCIYISLYLSFLICIIGVTSQGSYDDQVD